MGQGNPTFANQDDRMTAEPTIFDQETVPQGFIESFLWWAIRFSPSRENVVIPCGAHDCKQTIADVHPASVERISRECQEFWESVRVILKKTYGRVNWAPDFDNHERHASGAGGYFFWVRHGDFWHLDEWPYCQRAEFIEQAQKFCSMILKSDSEGKLCFEDDPDKIWHTEYRKKMAPLEK